MTGIVPKAEIARSRGPIGETLALLRSHFGRLGRADGWACLAIAACVTVVCVFRIEATQAATLVNNCIFGADSVTFWRWLLQGNYLGLGVHKHTLAVVLVAVLAHPLVWLGMPALTAVTLALAVIWGGVAAAAYLYFRQAGLSLLTALMTTTLAMSSLGIATHAGIAETYGATLLMIAVACALLPAAARMAEQRVLASACVAAATGAGLAIANAPATAFMLVYYVSLRAPSHSGDRTRLWLICVGIPLAAILLALIAPSIVAEGAAGTTWHRDYLGRYSKIANFTDVTTLTNFAANVLVFSFVAPLEFLQCRFVASDIAKLISSPLSLAAYLATVSLVIVGIARSIWGTRRRETLGLLGAATSILVFYLYFNPDEALLYSPQWLLAFFFAAAPDFQRAWAWAAAAAALCLSVNFSPLHDPRTSDPDTCCAVPPGSMLPREYPSALGKIRTLIEEAR